MSAAIRPATAADAACVAALGLQVWLDTYTLEGIRPALADYALGRFTPANVLGWLADPVRALWVAEGEGGHLLGYLLLVAGTDSGTAAVDGLEVETLYVSRHAHRQGVGRRLLAAGDRVAAARGEPALWLTTWHRNAAALAFYAACGFERVGLAYFLLEGERHLNHLLRRPLGDGGA
ncbi:GNAT family N-acetyltransferase [Chitinimonas koreensis]|uniref:GNAT family N-acetyltransferase n=1 Tax=Chitinimonas koreensis TaxID=356302 RepID=UPI00041BF763|nr:GNAT family N-acetyltransferase [Chitinimonas koreensis]QNM95902.1 GNAT family N-acetyltransferase [Chitinimonas koreensis]